MDESRKGDSEEFKGVSERDMERSMAKYGVDVVRKLIRRARRYISQGAKWVELQLKGKAKKIPVIMSRSAEL